MNYHKSGPAITIHVKTPFDKAEFDIDLVPAFEFESIHLGSHYQSLKPTVSYFLYNNDKSTCLSIKFLLKIVTTKPTRVLVAVNRAVNDKRYAVFYHSKNSWRGQSKIFEK